MKRSVTLELGRLGTETLKEQAAAHGWPVPTLVRYSVLYYLSKRDSGRLAWRVPDFIRSRPEPDAGTDPGAQLEVALELDHDAWRSLEAESERQRVTLPRLLEHAAILFMNDLSDGRVGCAAV